MNQRSRYTLCTLLAFLSLTGFSPTIASQERDVAGVIRDALAAESETAHVVSDGVGTVYVPPSHVRFWLHYELPVGDLETGLVASTALEVPLRAYLGARELRPSSLEIDPPHVASLEESRSTIAIALSFSMAGLVGGEVGAAKFGNLCESIKLLGQDLGYTVSGPHLEIAESAAVIKDAVQVATEQAYIGASGVAAALNGAVREVERVTIQGIEWNNPPDTEASYPTIELIACTARVQVTYKL